MTDVQDALPLIKINVQQNRSRLAPDIDVIVKELRWGRADVRKLRLEPLDIVVASDVIYEPDHLDSLLETLEELSTPGRTKIFIGYKPRGLPETIERSFFQRLLCSTKFSVQETLQLGYHVRVYCLERLA
ncbi:hypothetical protein BGZ83_006564 [Gryganskiella cystojenkinii]|nr:hypothetical protein BGZ83_006564 [Gryganskiella cystojenkinii]